LVAKLQAACKAERGRWQGLRLLAADKTTLNLPETKPLWKAFRGHSGQQGLGPIAVELCCLFDLVSHAPLRFIFGKASTSEHKLIPKLIAYLCKNDLLLLDAGFYSCRTFLRILARKAHFIIPASVKMRPRVLRALGPGDYLCGIADGGNQTRLQARVLFVYRNGFRRRRLVTSLLDPVLYPAAELAKLYHMRWDIETFYRDFKHSLRATSWHCQTPTTFHQELVVHMITLCLIRIAMLDASRLKNAPVSTFSFVRTLTEARAFLMRILRSGARLIWHVVWNQFVRFCARHRVTSKPGRTFTRDRQEYRRKSRGLERTGKGKKPKSKPEIAQPPQPQLLRDHKGRLFLLS
jgi:hypothetical protein